MGFSYLVWFFFWSFCIRRKEWLLLRVFGGFSEYEDFEISRRRGRGVRKYSRYKRVIACYFYFFVFVIDFGVGTMGEEYFSLGVG